MENVIYYLLIVAVDRENAVWLRRIYMLPESEGRKHKRRPDRYVRLKVCQREPGNRKTEYPE